MSQDQLDIVRGAPAAPAVNRSALQRRVARAQTWAAAWMVAPAASLLLLFVVIPVGLMFTLAFTDAKLVSPRPPSFIGLDNFTRLVEDDLFWTSLRNTLIFTVVVVPVQAGLALGLALLVNVKLRGITFFRTIYFLPVVTSIVVISVLWQFMYQPDGLINSLVATVGVDGPDWLGNPTTALFSIIVLSIWQAMGFHMVIWLSGLQTIPTEHYEAAAIDGANRWQLFRHITWPGLRQTRTFVLVTITIASFGLFTQIQVMTQGGPLDSTSSLVFHAFRAGYTQQQTGYASTISMVFFALVLAVSLVQRHLIRETED
ncbi:MAG: carbohydrate ABC transporter permease [Dermatophilaceae bacterium]